MSIISTVALTRLVLLERSFLVQSIFRWIRDTLACHNVSSMFCPHYIPSLLCPRPCNWCFVCQRSLEEDLEGFRLFQQEVLEQRR